MRRKRIDREEDEATTWGGKGREGEEEGKRGRDGADGGEERGDLADRREGE